MPLVWPIETTVLIFLGIRNFEVIFQLGRVLDGNTLYELSQAMIALHKRIGGRSEIRYSRPGATTPIFLDCAVARGHGEIFAMLKSQFGVTRCALHPGKHVALSTAPIERVSLAEVYGMLLPA